MTITALYRFFDYSGELLYAGITDDLRRRWRDHERHQVWWPEVDITRSAVQFFADREQAELAERTAIAAENPRHNLTYSTINQPTMSLVGAAAWLRMTPDRLLNEGPEPIVREPAPRWLAEAVYDWDVARRGRVRHRDRAMAG